MAISASSPETDGIIIDTDDGDTDDDSGRIGDLTQEFISELIMNWRRDREIDVDIHPPMRLRTRFST